METRISSLICIVGQTASGKTELALKIAKKYNGEIICADSRTVYKHLDIGTAKPSGHDREVITHHLLDIVSPNEEFSAAQFKELAQKSIKNIAAKGKIPILVGGTGLYIDSVIYNFQFGGDKNVALRDELEGLADKELQKKAEKLGISENKINFANRRHLIRAIERGGIISGDIHIRPKTLILGIDIPAEKLKEKIRNRIEGMLAAGLENEVRELVSRFGFGVPGMNTICYSEWEDYLSGEQTFDQLKKAMYKNTWQYARRQKTWFKRNKNINWITSVSDGLSLVQQFLIQ